jgi:hypothetical protein
LNISLLRPQAESAYLYSDPKAGLTMRLLIGVSLFLVSGMATGAEWRYCLAPSQAEHRIYLTTPFSGQTDTANAEDAFARVLRASGYSHDDVQCPRTDSEAASLEMQQHAIALNKMRGNEIVELHWPPDN